MALGSTILKHRLASTCWKHGPVLLPSPPVPSPPPLYSREHAEDRHARGSMKVRANPCKGGSGCGGNNTRFKLKTFGSSIVTYCMQYASVLVYFGNGRLPVSYFCVFTRGRPESGRNCVSLWMATIFTPHECMSRLVWLPMPHAIEPGSGFCLPAGASS